MPAAGSLDSSSSLLVSLDSSSIYGAATLVSSSIFAESLSAGVDAASSSSSLSTNTSWAFVASALSLSFYACSSSSSSSSSSAPIVKLNSLLAWAFAFSSSSFFCIYCLRISAFLSASAASRISYRFFFSASSASRSSFSLASSRARNSERPVR